MQQTATYFLSQEKEMLLEPRKSKPVFIGIPTETTLQENRVALVPSSVQLLTSRGFRVMVQTGAGEKSNYPDVMYSEAGAEIVYHLQEVYKADVILKVAPPTLDELELCKPNQVLISPLQVPIITEEYIIKLRQKRVIALAMEYIKDDNNSYPIVRIMSEIAGLSSILTAAELLTSAANGVGVLLGGIAGVPPAKVVILGAGVVGEFAARTAFGLGADVRVFDNNIYKIMRLQNLVGRQLYSSVINPITLAKELEDADVAIGAIHSGSGRTPMIVTEAMVNRMKVGSVVVDVSIDQGGCFETSKLTTHEKPTFKHQGVIHYCVPNIPSRVPRTASNAISNILTPILLKAEQYGGIERLVLSNKGLQHGVYTFKGALTNHYLSQLFGIRYTNIDLLNTSSL